MQVNNIAITADKCKKPCKTLSFSANEKCENKPKVRYKHIEEMSEDAITIRSIVKAHQQAQNSGKVRLYKAIPSMVTGLVVTSLAIAQPGKLSAKAASGLGFLATLAGVSAISDVIFSKDETKRKKAFATLGGLTAIGTGALMMSKSSGKTGTVNKVAKFITKESNQLAEELNKTKLAEISDKYIEPFMKKHKKFALLSPVITAVSSSVLGSLASVGLIKGISKDIKNNACKNYENAKMIQQIARDEFNKIDAIEV